MYLLKDKPVFSATDLTKFLGCRHLTGLDRLAMSGAAKKPAYVYGDDPMLEVLQERGLDHERAYVDWLSASGKTVRRFDQDTPGVFAATLEAMKSGIDVVVQARLQQGAWSGWADVLLRVPGQSSLGDWHYEPVETKLANETRGATLLQLCLYADMLEHMQGVAPAVLSVVKPDTDFSPERFRFAEYRAYFNLVRRNFEREMAKPLPTSADQLVPYPEPVPQCDLCDWYAQCRQRWVTDDHTSLVAGITKGQRKELAGWGVATLTGLATLPAIPKPKRGGVSTYERLRKQASLQLAARGLATPPYELLPITPDQGLAALPEPSPLDVFLDLEGDRISEKGGFDYLFGYAWRDEATDRYEAVWALSAVEEKAAFERLIDLVIERRKRDPGMHVYHYAPYEPTAMKRLMGKYGTRADELDTLLRGEVFVDLYSIVKRGLQAGVESYSIKRLEPLYGLVRQVDLRQASRELRAVELAIARKDPGSVTQQLRETVQGYNRDDCLSAQELHRWLEAVRAQTEKARSICIPRPSALEIEVSEKLKGRLAELRAVADALTRDLPVERTAAQEATWVLAQLLEWHRREEKVAWWEFFRLNDEDTDGLVDEADGLGHLAFQERISRTKKGVVVDRYTFPHQDTDIRDGADIFVPGAEKKKQFGSVAAIDLGASTIDIQKTIANAQRHPDSIFTHSNIQNPDAVDSLLRLGQFVRDHGIDDEGAFRAGRDLLLHLGPRLPTGIPLRLLGETTVQSARRAVVALDHGTLAIQGPPGAGKTYTGAHMIVDLVRAGKKVGITAVGHKTIRNLLKGVVEAAAKEGCNVSCMHRVSEAFEPPDDGIAEEFNPKECVRNIVDREYDVVGGTAWVWAKQEVCEAVDVLFVDEAGQMSLANVLACSQAATNLVLLGDPQQLEQPQRASHPEGSELSALQYLIEEHETIPQDRGLFLGETWRLHPSICQFTSELFYEGKLASRAGRDAQILNGPTPFAGAGLFYVRVAHEGYQNECLEEADKVATLVAELIAPGVTWTDCDKKTQKLTLDDILIVAPYNAQVGAIAERLPGARVGTVDKFQGQEAPVVIYSTTTSSSEEAPHGMEFLFSRNRLNVATSRAKCVCILVGNPKLFEPECRTPQQMRLANSFCRYLELVNPGSPEQGLVESIGKWGLGFARAHNNGDLISK